ncbi:MULTISPECIES: hypothetical protein [Rhizobium]|nr:MULTISPECIES: hypothetical protein [Rhizobium]ANM12517.1 hypothetical protein AMK05_CH04192 [Rhizobium sp. N324]ANM18920.1 hypothetical protein AMK06_CH04079 [Rhizobium sp. N541]ANM25305.1 hypothetical protein AMK07_CH04075 [Rhizobium sp. N941]OYD01692.1 hypothetical protein AMK08_CH200096 [Rhizobium sp. N4311]
MMDEPTPEELKRILTRQELHELVWSTPIQKNTYFPVHSLDEDGNVGGSA